MYDGKDKTTCMNKTTCMMDKVNKTTWIRLIRRHV